MKNPLIFGDKKQIEELKRENEKAIFCPFCNSANTWQDGDPFEDYDSFFCNNCGRSFDSKGVEL